MIKCGLYARVSTDLQAEIKNGSLDTQIDLLQTVCFELKDSTSHQRKNGKPLRYIVKKASPAKI